MTGSCSTHWREEKYKYICTPKNLKERILGRILEYEDVYWTHLAQDRVIRSTWGGRGFVNM
jgi:hypothetical protein